MFLLKYVPQDELFYNLKFLQDVYSYNQKQI